MGRMGDFMGCTSDLMELSGIYNIIYPQTNISMDIYGKSPCFMGKSNSMFMRKKTSSSQTVNVYQRVTNKMINDKKNHLEGAHFQMIIYGSENGHLHGQTFHVEHDD